MKHLVLFIFIFVACNLANAASSLNQKTDLNFKNKTMNAAFEIIKRELNINIETRGRIPNKSIDFAIVNATNKELLSQIMQAYSVKNFSHYFNNSTRTLHVTILDREENNFKSAMNQNELTSNLVVLDSDITQVKTLTPEELKLLADASRTGLKTDPTDNADYVANLLNFEQLRELEERYKKSGQGSDFLDASLKTLSDEELQKLPKTNQFIQSEFEQPPTLPSEVIQALKNKYALDERTRDLF